MTVDEIKQQDTDTMEPTEQSGSFSDHAPPTARLATILDLASESNICDRFDDDKIIKIGRDVVRLATLDDQSREEWMKKSKDAMDMAMQVMKQRTLHGADASSVNFPLLTIAALQFHARAYPAIVQNNKVVKGQVTGRDDTGEKSKQSIRVAQHMNYQILEQDEEWEEDVDKMLLALPIEGCEFKKTYFSPSLGHNVSEWVRPEDFIVNNKTKSLARCPRMTHRLWFYPYEINEKMDSKVWREDANLSISETDEEDQVLQEFYEQVCWLEVEETNIPVIVTVHKDSEEVVRIVPCYYADDIEVDVKGQKGTVREILTSVSKEQGQFILQHAEISKIVKIELYTKFGFIPNPDGTFYDIGFGQIIGKLNDAVNTNINQLIDAGTNASYQGGFVRKGIDVDGRRGVVEMERGVFKEISVPSSMAIEQAIFQLKFPEPSLVLFQLLGMLVQSVKDITSVQDIMVGGQGSHAEPATTSLSRIEQGLKVFSAIYKRLYRSLKKEFKKLYKLNARYLKPEEYFIVLDTREEGVIKLTDYQNDGSDVQPVADPNLATTMMAMAKAQALLSLLGKPGINNDNIIERYIDALDIPDAKSVVIPPEQRPQGDPEHNLKVMQAADEHVIKGAQLIEIYSKILLNIATAESKEVGTQLETYKIQMESIIGQWGMGNDQGRSVPMAAQQGDGGNIQGSPGQGTAMPGGMPASGQLV